MYANVGKTAIGCRHVTTVTVLYGYLQEGIHFRKGPHSKIDRKHEYTIIQRNLVKHRPPYVLLSEKWDRGGSL